MGLGRTGNLLLLKQRCYALSLPGQPLPFHSLSYKSHGPSVNYVTTQAGMGEKLENSISKFSKSLAEETEK